MQVLVYRGQAQLPCSRESGGAVRQQRDPQANAEPTHVGPCQGSKAGEILAEAPQTSVVQSNLQVYVDRKVKHLETRSLWAQDKIDESKVVVLKFGAGSSVADILTKYLSTSRLRSLLANFPVTELEGRHSLAPQLQVNRNAASLMIRSHSLSPQRLRFLCTTTSSRKANVKREKSVLDPALAHSMTEFCPKLPMR